MRIKNIPFIPVFLFLAFANAPISSSASPFYRETFQFCDTQQVQSYNATDIAGWKAFRATSSIGKVGSLKVSAPGSPNTPLSYNSLPYGPSSGGAFWSKTVEALTIFTDEFSFDVQSLTLVQYEQRLSGVKNQIPDGSQLAFLIGSKWYISRDPVRQINRGIWESISLEPKTLVYGISENKFGHGPRTPKAYNVSLPASGMITAFGLFFTQVNDKIRIDNFTVSDNALELRPPGAQGTAAQCGPVAPQPTGTPDPADPDPTPTPVPGVPTPTPTPTPSGMTPTPNVPVAGTAAVFCNGADIRALGKLSALPRTARNDILASFSGKTLKGARDKALLGLLLFNKLRVDNLVNVIIRDYYSVGTLQVLNASGVTQQTVPVKPKVKSLVDAYIALTGNARFGSLPLFQVIRKGDTQPTNTALCANQIAAVVKRKAAKAGYKAAVKFVG